MAMSEITLPMNARRNKEEKRRKVSAKTEARENEKVNVKRYNMALPETVYKDLKVIADINGITIAEVLRKYIKLGLIASEVENTPGVDLVVREEGRPDKTLVLI